MTIKNPELFIEAVRTTGDFGSEPRRGSDEALLERSDGATIRTGSSREWSGTWETIGLVSPSDDIPIELIYVHDSGEDQGYLNTIKVHVLRIQKANDGSLKHLYQGYYLLDNGGWFLTTIGLLNPKHYKKCEDSGMFVRQEDLLPQVDMQATADKFLEKVQGWMANPQSFETAVLKPELVPPALVVAQAPQDA